MTRISGSIYQPYCLQRQRLYLALGGGYFPPPKGQKVLGTLTSSFGLSGLSTLRESARHALCVGTSVAEPGVSVPCPLPKSPSDRRPRVTSAPAPSPPCASDAMSPTACSILGPGH